nr:DUF3145 family protein [Corynebacterium lactis]
MRIQTTGVLWIHSMPGPLQPHVSWALARLAMPDGTKPGRDIWRAQGTGGPLCAEVPFVADAEQISTLAGDLSRWPHLYFEIAQDPAVADSGVAVDGMRYCHTPELGTFAGQTDAAGNIVVNEDALRALIARGGDLTESLDAAIGGPWDRALEPLRMLTAGFDPEDCLPTAAKAADSHEKAPLGGESPSEGAEQFANVLQFYPRRAAM